MLKNIGSNWVLTLATIAATYVLLPFVINALGKEGYGTYSLIVSLTGYLNLLVLGIPMALVRYLAQHVAAGDQQKTNETIGSCAGLYLMMGLASLLVGAALFVFFTLTYHIDPAWRSEAHWTFFIVVLTVSFNFFSFLPDGILASHHDFVARNTILLGILILRLGLTLWLLSLKASIAVLASIQFLCIFLQFATLWLFIWKRYPNIRVNLAYFNWGVVRGIFSFSIFVLLLQMGGRINFETDALVIGAFLHVDQIPSFVVANSFLIYLIDFILAIASVVMPMSTKLQTEGRLTQLQQEVFLKWSKVAFSFALLAGLFLLVLGPEFIGWWIGPSFKGPSGQVLQILMASGLVFLPARGVALPLLMGLGKPKRITYFFLVSSLVNLGLSIALAKPLGLAGVALGTAVPTVAFALVAIYLACSELKIAFGTYLRYVIARAAFGALPVFGLLLWFKLVLQVETLFGLLGAGLAALALFGMIWVFYVYRKDPYVDLEDRLARLLAWSRA